MVTYKIFARNTAIGLLALTHMSPAGVHAVESSQIIQSKPSANQLVYSAATEFRKSDPSSVLKSIDKFNEAIEVKPAIKDYMWQLGISQYVAGQYKECGDQFRNDYRKNPNDTEEVVWAFLCDAKLENGENTDTTDTSQSQSKTRRIDKARSMMPSGKRDKDPRKVMRAVESVYRGQESEDVLKVSCSNLFSLLFSPLL